MRDWTKVQSGRRRRGAVKCVIFLKVPAKSGNSSENSMPIEIERKFLVTGEGWRGDIQASDTWHYRQGYLARGDVTVRVRICGDGEGASLAIKGRRHSMSRPEFEYPIPVAEAEEMLRKLAPQSLLEKTRHAVTHRGHVWSVDEFAGAHAGLVLAEIELSDPFEPFDVPDWIGREVTGEARYRNSILAETHNTPPRHFAIPSADAIPVTAKQIMPDWPWL
jgi:adenylate cyclase